MLNLPALISSATRGAHSGATGGDASETTLFLARTTGLDATHTNMYKALINGLVADGVFSKLDVFYFFATADTATALLNLCSSSFNGSAAGSPTFTADQGYIGVNASTTVAINTGFNPSTAGGQFTQNSAHVGTWSNTNVQAATSSGGMTCGLDISTNAYFTDIIPKFTDGKAYYRINDGTASAGITNSDATGHYVASRSAASTQKGYRNAVDQSVVSQTSGTLVSGNIYVLAQNHMVTGSPNTTFGGAYQLSAFHCGSNLSSTDVTNLYNRLVTARAAVGL